MSTSPDTNVQSHQAGDQFIDVRTAGAVGDGVVVDTQAINAAIQRCAAAGGGQVRFSPGKYLTATIQLRSDVSLHFEAGARLIGISDPEQYGQLAETPIGKQKGRWHRALISGEGVSNVTITGAGVIDGNKVHDPKGEERMRGPHTILLYNCTDIDIRDISIVDSANYAILFRDSDRIRMRNLHITGGWDGVHFRGKHGRNCRQIEIIDCHMFTGDDCIAGCHWDDVIIRGCTLNSSCNPVRVIGPAKNLIIQDCLIYGPGREPHRTQSRHNCLVGIIIQPGAWDAMPGPSDNILLSNLTMLNCLSPLMIISRPDHPIGRVVAERINATASYLAPVSAEGMNNDVIDHVSLRDCTFEVTEPVCTTCEVDADIPDPGNGHRPLPVWGVYGCNVNQLDLENVRLILRDLSADQIKLPAVRCDHVAHLYTSGLHLPEGCNPERAVVQNR